MIFKTIEEYDDKINELNEKINNYEQFVEAHPERKGVKGNIKTLKFVRHELIVERNKLSPLITNEEINLHVSGDLIKNHSIPSSVLINLIETYEDFIVTAAGALKFGVDRMDKLIDSTFKKEFGYNIKPFSAGSFMITFSPKSFEDNQTSLVHSLNKQSFDKLCDVINCGENMDSLMEQSKFIGTSSIVKYKDFMKVVSTNSLDITFNENNNPTPIINLSHDYASNIYTALKKLDKEENEIDVVELSGLLYYINTDTKQFGIKFFDDDLNKTRKLTVNFNENLKSELKNNLDSEINIKVKKTVKNNISKGKLEPIFELINLI